MGESNSNFRERLALALEKKGMTQVDLANATGVPYPTVGLGKRSNYCDKENVTRGESR